MLPNRTRANYSGANCYFVLAKQNFPCGKFCTFLSSDVHVNVMLMAHCFFVIHCADSLLQKITNISQHMNTVASCHPLCVLGGGGVASHTPHPS